MDEGYQMTLVVSKDGNVITFHPIEDQESKGAKSPNIKLRKAQGVSTLYNGRDIRVYHSTQNRKGATF